MDVKVGVFFPLWVGWKKKNLSIRYCAQLNIKALLCLNAHLHQCTPLRIQKLQGWKKLWKTLRSPLWFIMSALDLASQGGTCCGWCLPFLLQNGNIVPWKSATSPLKCLVGALHELEIKLKELQALQTHTCWQWPANIMGQAPIQVCILFICL